MIDDADPENTAETAADPLRRRSPGRPFPPGVSGNPGGRPKGSGRLSKAFATVLGDPFPDDPSKTYAEAIAEALACQAAAGDVAAAREIADRCEGKPTQRLENVQLREDFERMSREELLRYAETGETPSWFRTQGTSTNEN